MTDNILLVLEFFALILILSLILIFVVSYLFCGEEVQEFAPTIKGRITNKGLSVSHTKVKLKIKSSNYLFESDCLTNENGEFEFDSVMGQRKKILRCFDGLFNIIFSVEVTTKVGQRKVLLWKGIFREYVIGEIERENLSDLHCEVTSPTRSYEFYAYGDSVISQCELINFIRVNR